MGCARRGGLNVRVDHMDGSITFVDDPFTPTIMLYPPPSRHRILHLRLQEKFSIQPSTVNLVRTRLSRVL